MFCSLSRYVTIRRISIKPVGRSLYSTVSLVDPSIGLNPEQRLLQETATRFALSELRPNARTWDDQHHFPLQQLQSAAQLGFAALYTPLKHGGTGLGRLETSIVIESLAQGSPT